MSDHMDPQIASPLDAEINRLMEAMSRFEAAAPPATGGQYTGPVSTSTQVAGLRLTLANARHLLEDARVLFDASRWPCAAALAVLSHEESWKSMYLVVPPFNLDGSYPKGLNIFWRNFYRNHSIKSGTPEHISILLKQFAPEDLRGLSSTLGPAADRLKQAGFYSDYRQDEGKVRAISPESEIGEEAAGAAIDLAEASIKYIGPIEDLMIQFIEQGPETKFYGEDPRTIVSELASHYPGYQSLARIITDTVTQSIKKQNSRQATKAKKSRSKRKSR